MAISDVFSEVCRSHCWSAHKIIFSARRSACWPPPWLLSWGKSEERGGASLFAPGGTHALPGKFSGINDFEVVAYLVILPDEE